MKKLTNSEVGAAQMIGSTGGSIIDNASNNGDGTVKVGGKIASGALQGASMGMAFGPQGALIGAAAGALIGGISASSQNNKAKAEQEIQNNALKMERQKVMNEYSRAVLSTYPTDGVESASMYKYGGIMKTTNKLEAGGIMQVSPTASVASGDKHGVDTDGDGKGGIDAGNGNEVEDKEVIYQDALGNQKVLSDKLGFAAKAKEYMQSDDYKTKERIFVAKKDNITKQLGVTQDKFQQGTLGQRLKGVVHPLDVYFIAQEEMKKEQGIQNPNQQQPTEKFAMGGLMDDKKSPILLDDTNSMFNNMDDAIVGTTKMGFNTENDNKYLRLDTVKPIVANRNLMSNKPLGYKGALDTENADVTSSDSSNDLLNKIATPLSFLDNIYNASINNKRPAVPEPVLNKAVNLNTTYNITPQLEENRKQLGYLYKNLDDNLANPQTVMANKAAGYAANIAQANKLQGEKANIETTLKNQNLLNAQGVQASNNQLINQNNIDKMVAKDNKLTDSSENVANAVSKATMLIRQENIKELDKKKLAIIKAKYKSTGVLDRTDIEFINGIKTQ